MHLFYQIKLLLEYYKIKRELTEWFKVISLKLIWLKDHIRSNRIFSVKALQRSFMLYLYKSYSSIC